MYNQTQGLQAANNAIAGAPKMLSETQYGAQVLDGALARLEARVAELQMFSAFGRALLETSYRVEGIERRINGMLDTLAI